MKKILKKLFRKPYRIIKSDLPFVIKAMTQRRFHVLAEVYARSWQSHEFTNQLAKDVAVKVEKLAAQIDFAFAIDYLFQQFNSPSSLNYLEIGSARGLSMGFIGTYTKSRGIQFSGLSVDPYFETGYSEGAQNPYNITFNIPDYIAPINVSHRDKAILLWNELQLNVIQKRRTSVTAFQEEFLSEYVGEMDIVYVDGLHKDLTPMIDTVFSFRMLKNNGLIILDDWHWETVLPLKQCLDLSCKKVYETWKIAIYQVPSCF
jgi:hypothetical protein